MEIDSLVVTCEHASNRIPSSYQKLFSGAGGALQSHRGWDIGAAAIARGLADIFDAPLHVGSYSRLLVDLNRSPHHPGLFSEWTRSLEGPQREQLLAKHYWPYRRTVEEEMRTRLRAGNRVLHLSVHSFTPAWRGVPRGAHLGLLYDPGRPAERSLCAQWKRELRRASPLLEVRRNYPYRGTSDGLSVALRRSICTRRYVCVELEINQQLLDDDNTSEARALTDLLARTLNKVGLQSRR